MKRERWKITLLGMVQGIGFRPFVYRIAHRYGLTGFVLNDSRGAEIQVEGITTALDDFWRSFWKELPPLAQVADWHRETVATESSEDFEIRSSRATSDAVAFVTPDAHLCEDCRAEIFSPSERRYRYPFTNCTNCGPRYTIIQAVPYDRPNTTMSEFPMCEACRAEYENPLDRRFHAQPIACPDCGPRLWLTDASGHEIESADPLFETARALSQGQIVAIKGLGGFHLAVDAANEQAVVELRRRKWREGKPFALMVADIETAHQLVVLDQVALDALNSPARPIVLAPMRAGARVAPSVAPGLAELGIMLPYTPMHSILMQDAPPVLVMTSGNLSGEPLIFENQEALDRLSGIADLFVLHDRRIHNPCDDSVVRSGLGRLSMVRRARGYAPAPIVPRAVRVDKQILAVGPELKNTLCLTRKGQVVPSQHIGDLSNPRAWDAFEKAVDRLADLLAVSPELLVCDMHPEYPSTRYARRLAQERGLPLLKVQHHHAHMASCMLDNDLPFDAKVLGIIWDGTGYGLDGTVWGGEFFVGGYREFERVAHLRPMRLPGGDAATRHPWRLAFSVLFDAGFGDLLQTGFVARQDPGQVRLLETMLARDLRCAPSSGAGRLFDVAAAILDFHPEATDQIQYEAQLAIELEALAAGQPPTSREHLLPFDWTEQVLDFRRTFTRLARQKESGQQASVLAARFIDTMAAACATAALDVAARASVDQVVFSGGCFQNHRLEQAVLTALDSRGLTCMVHRNLPPNDGGLSVGQAAVALAEWSRSHRP